MRKLNNLLAILIFVLFIGHGVTSSLLLIGVINKPIKTLSYLLLIVVIIHGLIGMYATRNAFRNKKWYLKENISIKVVVNLFLARTFVQ